MNIKSISILILVFVVFSLKTQSGENKIIEEEMRSLALELRCMVCQNQTVLDSDSDLAKDIRKLIIEKLEKGNTKEEIKSFLLDRYGEFILFKPKFNLANSFLWFSPVFFLFLIGLLAYKSVTFNSRKKDLNKTTYKKK